MKINKITITKNTLSIVIEGFEGDLFMPNLNDLNEDFYKDLKTGFEVVKNVDELLKNESHENK
jgi:hypothetical protein